MDLWNAVDSLLSKRKMANLRRWTEAPFVHFAIVNVSPILRPRFNSLFARHPQNAAWSPTSPALLVTIECDKMKVWVLEVVSDFVVDGQDVARLALRQRLCKRTSEF